MENFEKLQIEINAIKERNKRVEADKAWEVSLFRKVVIALLTYFVIVSFMYFSGLAKPFVNAIVPTVGFILSTLTIGLLKKYWINNIYK